jgi:hypothetical protein
MLNQRNLCGKAVEIGVKQGHFSDIILSTWKGLTLYLVDPWCEQAKQVYDESCHDYDTDFDICLQKMKPYGSRCKFIKDFSYNAYHQFEDNSLDFVYVDGNHSYDAVSQDLCLWYPKLRRNGIMAGDDYTIEPIEQVFDCSFGVKKAVDEFAIRHHKNVSIDLYGDWMYNKDGHKVYSRNWYFVK